MKYAIYGTGECAREISANLKAPCYFYYMDDNPNKNIIYNNKINNNLSKSVTVIMGVFNPFTDTEAIKEKLWRAGYNKIISYVDIHKKLKLPDRYWLGKGCKLSDKNFGLVADMLQDGKSKELLFRLHLLRECGWQDKIQIDGDQYFLHDDNKREPGIPKVKLPLRFVDCGAFTGDTIKDIIARKLKVDFIEAYEPDIHNYLKLVESLPGKEQGIWAYSSGLYSKTCKMRFNSDGTAGAKIGKGDKVQFYKLDDVVISKPNYIKIDTEGSDKEVLYGAEMTIKKCLPRIAVSLYHKPKDLWEIPLLIRSWNLPYNYYLRQHGYNGFETVLYCVPEV